MSVLRYALLGLLSKESRTGYELVAEFEHPIGNFWMAQHSQVYPELSQMHQDDLIHCVQVKQEGKPDKKVYSLTPKGSDVLQQWLHTFAQTPRTMRDEFMLKAYFMGEVSAISAREQFESQLKDHEGRLQTLEHSLATFIQEQEGRPIRTNTAEFGRWLVVWKGIMTEKTYVEWCRKALQWLEVGEVQPHLFR